MEYEKQPVPQFNQYPTAPAGDQYPPPYAACQSPPPGGMAYPQAGPQQPGVYPQQYNPNQPYGQPGYPIVATQQPYGQAGYPSGQAGQLVYAYPGPGQPGVYGQPQPVVVMAGYGPQTVVVAQQTTVSMIGAIVLSCFVLWCCGCLCGLIAFIVALVGQNKSTEGKTQSAIQLRNVSYGISVVGIVVGIILVAVMVMFQRPR